jgi:hypothetical protein
MSDIQHLIEMLKSDNPNKRYDACEELRVAQHPLPQDAMDALHAAINDSNPEVADAAQRAITLHTPQLTPDVFDEQEQEKEPTEDSPNKNLSYIIIGFVAGAIPGPIAWSMRWGSFFSLDGYSVFLLIIGGIAGAIGVLIGGSSTKNPLGAAIVGGVAGLLFGGLCSLNGL